MPWEFSLSQSAKPASDRNSPSALQALLFFPTSFFFMSGYSESLFLLCSVGFLLELRRRRFPAAALWGFLAALTRPTGIVLAVPALWAAWEARRSGERPLWKY